MLHRLAPVEQAEARRLVGHAQRRVVEDAAKQQQGLVLAVLGREADAGGDRRLRAVRLDRGAVHEDRAAEAAVIADDRLGELGAAGAHQAGNADDLALAHRQADVADLGGRQPLHLQQRLAGAPAIAREQVGDVAADHQLGDGLLAGARGRRIVDQPPVAQHDDAVGELDDLVQPVRDVDDRGAVGAQAPDDREQPARLVVGQRRGRLVEGDQPAAGAHRAHDLDHLPLRRAERRAQLPRPHVALHAERRQHLGLSFPRACASRAGCRRCRACRRRRCFPRPSGWARSRVPGG